MNILVMQCIDSDIKQTELQNNGIISVIMMNNEEI